MKLVIINSILLKNITQVEDCIYDLLTDILIYIDTLFYPLQVCYGFYIRGLIRNPRARVDDRLEKMNLRFYCTVDVKNALK